ncbi:MAG TPA: S8 family peptidase [Byssovorax sp.]|jgi:serine protease
MRTARLHTARLMLASTALAALASLTWSAAAAADTPVVLSAGDPTVDYVDETVEEASAWEVPGEVLVDAKDGLDAGELAKLATDYGVTFHATALAAETNEEVADVSPAREDALVDALRHDARVEIAEPLLRMKALYVPNDPLMKDQWHLTRVGAERAWDYATGRGVTVAVIDTGIACEDFGPFMKGTDLKSTECVAGWNFVSKNEHANDDQGHGTHVAGTIAQSTDNGVGAAGLAFHARLMPVKVLSAEGWGTTADIADGVRWAAEHGAQVINMSLGGPRNSGVLQKAIDYAVSRGVVVVAAAGNSGGAVGYPGANEGVIGVSASDPDDKLANFSSRGPAIDIAAPGVNVTQQTICNKGRDKCENYAAYNGTSMASPHVAGAAALVVSLGVTEPAAVEAALKASARVVDDSEAGKKLYGAGILDAGAAVARVTEQHALVRLLALAALALLAFSWAKKERRGATSPFKLGFIVPALATGPGLFFFAPWILPRVSLVVDAIARPLADLDLLVGVSLHRFLPLANAAIPFALMSLLFGVKKLRPVVAGVATGTAAYLGSVVVLGDQAGPFGHFAMLVWCAGNALVCTWIAKTNLSATD